MLTVDKILHRLTALELRVDELERGKVEPPVPVVTPPTPTEPVVKPFKPDYVLDMNVSNHIDFGVIKGEIKIIEFTLPDKLGDWLTHITAVLMGSGPLIKLSIKEYGYDQPTPSQETSESIATSNKYTDWVVPKGKRVYLRVTNYGEKGIVRLRWSGANAY